ncbi:MAG: efflux RND transporter periplasmic adaptor subunit [Verrucomicrobiales bacterium]
MKTLLTILLTAALAVTATWFVLRQPDASASAERKPLFYQSPMHPWVKSDKPGRCTICGMELVPIYPGDKSFDETGGGNVVALTQNQIQVVGVQTVTAKVQPLTRTLQVAGMIDDDASRHRFLSAYVDGRVEKLFVNTMGAEVAEGQPLADFYSPGLLQTEREYRQLSGDLKIQAGLRLRQMGLNQEQIRAVDQKPNDVLTSQILSPISGTVVGQNVYEGQTVATGDKLLEIADFSDMWFVFRAYEQDLPWVKLGETVSITTPSLPGRTLEGKIAFIDPNFDEATRSTNVRVILPNPIVNGRRELLHKLYADGSVNVEAPDVLSVPRSAVIQTGPEAVVYVDRGNGAYARNVVRIGRRGDALLEVISGLKEGDKVVTNGNLLIDGQAEMNRSFTSEEAPPTKASEVKSLNEEQQKALAVFLKMADEMAKSLANDDLAAFNEASAPSMMETSTLTEALRKTSTDPAGLDALDEARHFHGFENLKSARSAFLKFTLAATNVLQPLRSDEGAPAFEVWECAMVNQAIPGAAKKGRWLQLGGRPGLNPFFGKEMQDCATEIKP